MNSKYLTFLDLGSQTNIFYNVDDGAIEIELPSTLNVGKYLFNSLNVRLNSIFLGIILTFTLI